MSTSNAGATKHFTATITKSGSKAYIVVPFDPNAIWKGKDRHYVAGSIGDCRIRGFLRFDGTQFVLPLGPAWLRDNDVQAGTSVDVVLSQDGPRSGMLAADITAALDAEPKAATLFHSVAPFYRKNFIRWIESAKRPETRAARIAEMMSLLRAGRKQR